MKWALPNGLTVGLAVVSMLADSIGIFFFAGGPVPLPLQMLGEIWFPILAWITAEGFFRTSSQRHFLIGLGASALLHAGLSFLIISNPSGERSVLVSFFLTAAALLAFEKCKNRIPLATALLPLLGVLLLAELLSCVYGAPGVLLMAGLYLWSGTPEREKENRGRCRFLIVWCLVYHLLWRPLPELLQYFPGGIYTPDGGLIFREFLRVRLPVCLLLACSAGSSVFWLTRREPNGRPIWFLTGFYLMQQLILAGISALVL